MCMQSALGVNLPSAESIMFTEDNNTPASSLDQPPISPSPGNFFEALARLFQRLFGFLQSGRRA